jgi:PAS domain S-box-containing protein
LDQTDHLEDLVNKRSDEILRQKLFYEALMENSPIAIVTLDQHHQVISINPAFEDIFDYRTDEIMGKNLDDLVRQEAYDITKGVLAGKTMHEFGKRRRKDGTLVSVDLSKQVKQRVLDQVALHNQSNSEDMQLSISIGCGTAQKGDLLADVFKLADEHMYHEKQRKKKQLK